MIGCIVLLVLGAICLTLFIIEKVRKTSVKSTMIKATTSFLFITLAAYSVYRNGNPPFGFFTICGLAMGLLGDIWLGLKHVYKEHTRTYTFAGFTCFAVGHMFYIYGMMRHLAYPNVWYAYLIPLAFGLLCGGAVLLLEKPLKYNYKEYKIISFVYGVLLFGMVATAGYLAIANKMQVASYNMLFIGGILFALSDLILCGTYFGVGKDKPFDLISNSITYYVAQYLIAFSIFFL